MSIAKYRLGGFFFFFFFFLESWERAWTLIENNRKELDNLRVGMRVFSIFEFRDRSRNSIFIRSVGIDITSCSDRKSVV